MPTPFTLPPDTRAIGQGNPPADMNGVVDALTAQGAALSVLNTAYSGGADPTGVADSTAAIQAALNAASPGQAVLVPPGTYKTTSVLTIPTGVTLIGWPPGRTMAIPTGNYGIGGVPLQGAIIKPTGAGITAAVQFASNASTQYGNQSLRDITINGASMTSGTGHGILADAVAGVTLQFVTVVNVIGDGLHCAGVAGTGFHPPDFWQVTSCKFSNCGAWGVNIAGLADSFFTDCESTGNGTGGGWSVTNCGNTRFVGCKGEQNGSGPGWLLTAQSGFSGQVLLTGCTAQNDAQDGYRITGNAAPNAIYKISDCSSTADGQNGGIGGGGYAGLQVTSFAGTVLAPGFGVTAGTSPASPQYGIAATSSGTIIVDVDSAAGATQALHDGGGNALLQVRSSAVDRLPSSNQMGILAQSYSSLMSLGGSAAATSGTVYLIRVPLYGGTATITNVIVAVQTAGSTLTTGQNFAGVYDSAGTKLGGTADQTTPWGSTGLKTMALTGGPFTTTSQFVYVVLVSNGTTPPAFARLGGGSALASLITLSSAGSQMPFATNGTGTALPASLTYSSNSATGAQGFWAALS